MIEELYTKLQNQVYMLIPEKWESIYLYASVTSQIKYSQTWEMYFYYYPKSVLKRNPINVYEIPAKFNLDEEEYMEFVRQVCETIKEIQSQYKNEYKKAWYSMTLSITEENFRIDYNNLNYSKLGYSDEEHHIIWKYKYLKFPIEKFNKKDRSVIERYLREQSNEKIDSFTGKTTGKGIYNPIDYSITQCAEDKKNVSKQARTKRKLSSLPINQNKKIDEKVEIKNQMLRFD